jgi:hypothetical protein
VDAGSLWPADRYFLDTEVGGSHLIDILVD